MLWEKNGYLIENAAGQLCDDDECPCTPGTGTGTFSDISTCFTCLGYNIQSKLNITYTYGGFSKTFPLTLVYNDGITAVWQVIGGSWTPCGSDGPIFNLNGPLLPDQLVCNCITAICPLELDTSIDNGGGIPHSIPFRIVGCPGDDNRLTIVSSSPSFHATVIRDLTDILPAGTCGTGDPTLDINITKRP